MVLFVLYLVGTVIIPKLQMGKLRLRMVKQLA